jgi:hypothetical protein
MDAMLGFSQTDLSHLAIDLVLLYIFFVAFSILRLFKS